MTEEQGPRHVRVALYERELTTYLFCDANFMPTDETMAELQRKAEGSPDFVEGIQIIFGEDASQRTEFAYVVSLSRETSDEEIERLLPILLEGLDFGYRWLMSGHELLPRQKRLVRRHQAGALDDGPTA